MTTAEAAKILGLSEFTVRQKCNKGQLAATKRGRSWVLLPASVEVARQGNPNRSMRQLIRAGMSI